MIYACENGHFFAVVHKFYKGQTYIYTEKMGSINIEWHSQMAEMIKIIDKKMEKQLL